MVIGCIFFDSNQCYDVCSWVDCFPSKTYSLGGAQWFYYISEKRWPPIWRNQSEWNLSCFCFIFYSHAQVMWVYGMAKALGRPAGWPAMYWTFNTNHLSYIKTLVLIYIFRAITFFGWYIYIPPFLEKKMAILPQTKKTFLWAYFREALIVAPPFLDMCLDIYGAWIN